MDKVFGKGIFFNKPLPQAPPFVKGNVSINRQEFVDFLNGIGGDKIVLDLKEGRSGKLYFELNTYKKNGEENKPTEQESPLVF
jgi:hypothetical protein